MGDRIVESPVDGNSRIEIPVDLIGINEAVKGIPQPEAIIADIAKVMLIYISIGKSCLDRIMRGKGTFIVSKIIVVGDIRMLILPEEYSIPGVRKIVILDIIGIGYDHQDGRTIAGILFRTVDMIGNVLVNMAGISPEHPYAIRCIPRKIIVVNLDAVAMI
jgi:hypothetical protein